jgi:hypothetical protein
MRYIAEPSAMERSLRHSDAGEPPLLAATVGVLRGLGYFEVTQRDALVVLIACL